MSKRVTAYLIDRSDYCTMRADSITIHGDYVYAYSGDDLVGVFRETELAAIYMTEPNPQNNASKT